MVKLFVGGFPLDMNEMDLAKLIAPHGTISTIKMIRDRATKKLKGYAFVEMATEADAEQAIEALHNTEMGDRVLTLKVVEETEAAPTRRPAFKSRPTQQRSTTTSYNRVNTYSDPNKKKRPRRSS